MKESVFSGLTEAIDAKLVTHEVASQLLHYWESKMDNPCDLIYRDMVAHYLFANSIHTASLHTCLYNPFMKQVFYDIGLLDDIKLIHDLVVQALNGKVHTNHDFHYEGCTFLLKVKSFFLQNNIYVLLSVFPRILEYNFDFLFANISHLFVSNTIQVRPKNFYESIYAQIENDVIKRIKLAFSKNTYPVHLVGIQIESIQSYVAIKGIVCISMLKSLVTKQIEKIFGLFCQIYIFSPTQILLLVNKHESKEIEKLLSTMECAIDTILLHHTINILQLEQCIPDLSTAWFHLYPTENVTMKSS